MQCILAVCYILVFPHSAYIYSDSDFHLLYLINTLFLTMEVAGRSVIFEAVWFPSDPFGLDSVVKSNIMIAI